MKRTLMFVMVCIISVQALMCQDKIPRLANMKKAGFLIEYGSPYYYLPEGQRYYILPVGVTFSLPFFKIKPGKFFNMSVDFFPHYVFAWVDDERSDFEYGLNVRLGLDFSLSANDVLSLKIGSGPHYITVETEKQANGFIFADYYLIAYDRLINIGSLPFVLEFEFGYRHISNGWISEPNRSISNFIFGMGFSKAF